MVSWSVCLLMWVSIQLTLSHPIPPAMKRMASSKVLVVGLKGLGVEIGD